MNKGRIVCTLLAALAAAPAAGEEILLGAGRSAGAASGFPGPPQLNAALVMVPSGGGSEVRLFEGVYTNADEGKTFVANAETASNFPLFARLLTNGIADSMLFADNFGSFGTSEEGWFTSVPANSDFAGAIITRIELRFAELSITPSATIPATFDWKFTPVVSVFGERGPAAVPEPASLSLTALGVAAAAVRRWRTVQGRRAD
jgi:hypothetical protein